MHRSFDVPEVPESFVRFHVDFELFYFSKVSDWLPLRSSKLIASWYTGFARKCSQLRYASISRTDISTFPPSFLRQRKDSHRSQTTRGQLSSEMFNTLYLAYIGKSSCSIDLSQYSKSSFSKRNFEIFCQGNARISSFRCSVNNYLNNFRFCFSFWKVHGPKFAECPINFVIL